VIYDVRYVDNGKERKVMYRGSMPEMVVLALPTAAGCIQFLTPVNTGWVRQPQDRCFGADAPENAVYLPATLIKESREPFVLDSAVAVYEQNGGTCGVMKMYREEQPILLLNIMRYRKL
jgi:primary-amine oxidase